VARRLPEARGLGVRAHIRPRERLLELKQDGDQLRLADERGEQSREEREAPREPIEGLIGRLREGGAVADNFAELSARKAEVDEVLLALRADVEEQSRVGRREEGTRRGRQKQVRPKGDVSVRVVAHEDTRKLGIGRGAANAHRNTRGRNGKRAATNSRCTRENCALNAQPARRETVMK
jgi:hypothetical protein